MIFFSHGHTNRLRLLREISFTQKSHANFREQMQLSHLRPLLPIISAAPPVWCDRALFSPSRSTVWTCGGRPTMRRSVPSGMQEAASGWQFSETGLHLRRCQIQMEPRTSGEWRANSPQTREARQPKQHRWREQRLVCLRARRRLSATAMTLWVICWYSFSNRTSGTIFTPCVSSLCVSAWTGEGDESGLV